MTHTNSSPLTQADDPRTARIERGAMVAGSYVSPQATAHATPAELRELILDLRFYVEDRGGDFDALVANRAGWAAQWDDAR